MRPHDVIGVHLVLDRTAVALTGVAAGRTSTQTGWVA
jgi:hypothetical protein